MNRHAITGGLAGLTLGLILALSSSRGSTEPFQPGMSWAVIATAAGQPGDLGRREAMENLNRGGYSMLQVDVSEAPLAYLELPEADLREANLARCDLQEANLREAGLWGANLSHACLSQADLTWANLCWTDLSGTDFGGAILDNAALIDVEAVGADFQVAQLNQVFLGRSDLEGARFDYASLEGARIHETNFRWASLRCADLANLEGWETIGSVEGLNIEGVRNAPAGFVEWALERGAVSLPPDEWEALRDEVSSPRSGVAAR